MAAQRRSVTKREILVIFRFQFTALSEIARHPTYAKYVAEFISDDRPTLPQSSEGVETMPAVGTIVRIWLPGGVERRAKILGYDDGMVRVAWIDYALPKEWISVERLP